MLISHAAMSTGSIGFPRLGVSAIAAPAKTTSAAKTLEVSGLRVNMLDHSLVIDSPACHGIEVLVRKGQDGRNLLQLAALGHELGAGRLHIARLVPRAAL